MSKNTITNNIKLIRYHPHVIIEPYYDEDFDGGVFVNELGGLYCGYADYKSALDFIRNIPNANKAWIIRREESIIEERIDVDV